MSKKTEDEKQEITTTASPSRNDINEEKTLVYCGPSVRNVVRQYTVYTGTIPQVLAQFLDTHPAAQALLVSIERFAEVRTKLETKGTAEAVLYNKVKSEL